MEQQLSDFDAVTRVNYRGYFIGVKAVTPVMAAQHAANPGIWCDIVEINSKSGLTGSGRNFAYSGSKFGGIGLTQSFALELVDSGRCAMPWNSSTRRARRFPSRAARRWSTEDLG